MWNANEYTTMHKQNRIKQQQTDKEINLYFFITVIYLVF